MAASTFVVSASRAGVGSVVVAESSTKTMNVADVGTLGEGSTTPSGGGVTQTVRAMVLA